ncbi:hypothetical protein CPHO_08395 [Corynebacterium phocae]|uniref:Uncharacterized protein n=1 Tax=Corynebacterium phocae TaxID=161895 RepID=A0A1L7D4H0_9CORY|nr:hypothetical protein [Corynebacterium phocae]APT92903.1 hypothetical protein CPHO_08395 [Corynebacterium phocae]KAA8723226.1 hypothetical protein F4V58_07890 [Corynebacterium phocae]
MTTVNPVDLDKATIDLIFILRDSLTDNGPSRMEFWADRATTAIAAAAAGAESFGQAVTIAAHKLQIDTLTAAASKRLKTVAETLEPNFQEWVTHVDKTLVYIVALAKTENTIRKEEKAAKKSNTKSEEAPF